MSEQSPAALGAAIDQARRRLVGDLIGSRPVDVTGQLVDSLNAEHADGHRSELEPALTAQGGHDQGE